MTRFGTFGMHFPPVEACIENVVACEQMGYDFVNFADQLQTTHPKAMWTPDLVSAANVWTDGDQWFDAFQLIAAASQHTDRVRLGIGVVDTQRRNPAVLAQMMVTASHLTKGRCYFTLGTGEHKQFYPYGEERQRPTDKLEEAMRIIRELWSSGGRPVNRDSDFWPLRDAIFALPPYDGVPPKLYVAGGGPHIEEIVGELADGWLVYLHGGVEGTWERFAATVERIKAIAERHGRDPEALDFIGMPLLIIGRDDDEARSYFRSPMIQWNSIIATPSAETWVRWGYDHPLGNDFVFSRDFTVTTHSREEALAACAQVPDDVTERVCVWGSPERVADQLRPYLDSGMTDVVWISYSAYANAESAAYFPELVSDVITRLGGEPLDVAALARGGTAIG